MDNYKDLTPTDLTAMLVLATLAGKANSHEDVDYRSRIAYRYADALDKVRRDRLPVPVPDEMAGPTT